ncbi:TetR/AcrR family transcriptional regulator [Salinarimonas ramus]|uniref:TetR family transcriptional regulator n=1 Tax=Salinarimonas ramus TaxID=690164 RepID=A0A917Q6C8_9HYPH|nr:TetR/AcrR family transcriptional regulator [Salinarimonas ramus]GGK29661.1 TetR family transcriptional regulator [Salinarimonas ramus]
MAQVARRTQEERREDSERRMLEAGVRIVAERGMIALTLDRVGVEAGYSRGLPRHHFGTKAAYEAALLAFVNAQYQSEIAGLERAPGLDGLFQLVRGFCDMSKDPLCVCVATLILSATDLDEGRETVPGQIAELRAFTVRELERQIADGIAAGDIRPTVEPARLARILIVTLTGLLSQWSKDRAFDLAGAGEDLVALLASGIAAIERKDRVGH